MKKSALCLLVILSSITSYSQEKTTVKPSTHLVVQGSDKVDSPTKIEIDSLALRVNRLESSVQSEKRRYEDRFKWLYPLIGVVIGFALTVLKDLLKESKIEKRAITRWKSEISSLSTAIHNQIHYNLEVLQVLLDPRVLPITPRYDLTLDGTVFNSLDKGILFHFLEKQDLETAVDINSEIRGNIGKIADLFRKNNTVADAYRARISNIYEKYNNCIQDLQLEIGNLVLSHTDQPSDLPDAEGVVNSIHILYKDKILNRERQEYILEMSNEFFRPLHASAQAIRHSYKIDKLLELALRGKNLISEIDAERNYYRHNLTSINKELEKHLPSISIMISRFK